MSLDTDSVSSFFAAQHMDRHHPHHCRMRRGGGEISARFIVGANRTAEDGFRAWRAAKQASPLMPPSSSYFAIAGDSL